VERWDDWIVQQTTAALIWDKDTFTLHHTAYNGQLTDDYVKECLDTFNSRVQRKSDNIYWNADAALSQTPH
jgi:hypothetical protein